MNAIRKVVNSQDGSPQSRTRIIRGKGTCEISGPIPHYERIVIERGVYVKVNATKYNFTGSNQWEIFSRFAVSLNNGDNHAKEHFPVKFTSADYNKCKGNCRTLINDFVERQPVARRIRNKQYEDKARFKIELLK